ncbi:MAG TPA: SIS domain-containing protein [Armatimonadota bacterium]|nr:SIS domain-containing protein [Armatimonadota bacterium]
MTFMLEEIHEQPEILERLCDEEYGNVQKLYGAMQAQGIEHIAITARGTSDNAAMFGKYLLEIVGGMVVSMAAPSVFTLYHAKLDLSKWLVIGISQSGESTDVIDVLKQAKQMGALTAGITNARSSTLAQTADFMLYCHAGKEKSVAATKTYTATQGVLYLLTSLVAKNPKLLTDLKDAAGAIRSVFEIEGQIEGMVERYRYMQECMVIARGLNHATCQEAALKLSETCYVVAKPYSGADFLHGPIASIYEGFPVFLYAAPGHAYQPMLELAEKLEDDKAEMVIISTEDEILGRATTPIKLPVEVDETFSPLVYVVVGQLFANYLSLTKGYNPDHPRHLTKITRTM